MGELLTSALLNRARGALIGMFIGDSLSMPVHWYYDRSRIFSDFGAAGITKYERPVDHFPGSIMSLSNTGGGGWGTIFVWCEARCEKKITFF